MARRVSLFGHFTKYDDQARTILIKNLKQILEKHYMEFDESTLSEIGNFLKWSSPQSIYYGNLNCHNNL